MRAFVITAPGEAGVHDVEPPVAAIVEQRLEIHGDTRVDVVIPVHGDRERTLDCIGSVRRSGNRTPIEIVVIDDATAAIWPGSSS